MSEETDRWLNEQRSNFTLHGVLLENIKAHLPEFVAIHERHATAEDLVYRYYHHSFKVYRAQAVTLSIVELLKKVDPKPEPKLNDWFMQIVSEGTGQVWELSHNNEWTKHTRPIVEAYMHAVRHLQAAVKYGVELEKAPSMLPPGWAMLLEVFCIR